MLFDPTAPARERREEPRLMARLEGAVVGFIDNAKPNFDHLVDDLADLLESRHGVRAVVKRRKRAASVPAPGEMMRELTGQCDLVITGSGD